MFFNNNNRKRNRNINRSEILSDNGSLGFQQEQSTEIFDNGDCETIINSQSYIIGGEKVNSERQIFGKCQDCDQFVTRLNRRICFCGKIICATCSEWWEDDKRPVCSDCYKILKKKKFWSSFWHLILSPFIERKDQ